MLDSQKEKIYLDELLLFLTAIFLAALVCLPLDLHHFEEDAKHLLLLLLQNILRPIRQDELDPLFIWRQSTHQVASTELGDESIEQLKEVVVVNGGFHLGKALDEVDTHVLGY